MDQTNEQLWICNLFIAPTYVTGVIEALVKHIDKAVTGVKLQNSQSFRPELLEHLSEVQKSDSDVKAAISEVLLYYHSFHHSSRKSICGGI